MRRLLEEYLTIDLDAEMAYVKLGSRDQLRRIESEYVGSKKGQETSRRGYG